MTQRHDSNPTLGPSAPGGRGRGVKHTLGKYQARGRRQETSPGARPGAPPALQSDLLPSAPRGVSHLLASPSSFRARPSRHSFFSHKVSRGVCVQDVVPPSSGPPPRAPGHAPTRPASAASPSLPTPPAPAARRRPPASRARAARTAPGAALDKHLSRLGSARFGGESIGNSGRVLARFRKFPTARVVSELSSGRRWEGGVA